MFTLELCKPKISKAFLLFFERFMKSKTYSVKDSCYVFHRPTSLVSCILAMLWGLQ